MAGQRPRLDSMETHTGELRKSHDLQKGGRAGSVKRGRSCRGVVGRSSEKRGSVWNEQQESRERGGR
jgi:hypothetical protein